MRRTVLLLAICVGLPLFAQRIPLNELGSARYLDYQGGLYEHGANEAPADHLSSGLRHAALVVPRDRSGNPSPSGRIVMISIGMSNTTQEFCVANNPAPCTSWSFVGQAMADPAVNHSTLLFVNGARGGQTADTWDAPTDANYDRLRDTNLLPGGVTEAQVQVAWVKVANAQPRASLPSSNADAFNLVAQMGGIARALKVRYPNLQIAYFSSRIYAGYATTTLNPEPYAYESAFAVKWLIQAQVDQMRGGTVDARAGNLNGDTVAPWIGWGAYLWADGMNPRSDQLVWSRQDFEGDGTHPSTAGEGKVGTLLLTFLKSEPTAQGWFTSSTVGPRRRAVKR